MSTQQKTPDPLLTAEELAARLRVEPDTVRRWARDGAIPVFRVRQKVLRFDYQEVVAAIRSGEKGAGCAS